MIRDALERARLEQMTGGIAATIEAQERLLSSVIESIRRLTELQQDAERRLQILRDHVAGVS